MRKKLLIGVCALLCVAGLLSMLTVPAEAACKHIYEDGLCTRCGQIGGSCGTKATWKFNSTTGILSIEGSGTMKTYSTAVPAPWASYKEEIKRVVIGPAITSISAYAFNECSSLTTINIPRSVSSISTSSFYKCYSLEEFRLDDNGNYFLDDKGVLYNKKQTYLIALPGIFAGVCEIPSTVTTVGPNAFSYVKGVTEIRVDEKNTKYSSDAEGLLYNKGKTQLVVCPRAFSGDCYLPATVTKYAKDAFTDCYGLTGIYVDEANETYCSDAAGLFFNKAGTELLLCPAGAQGTCTIPASVTSYDTTYAFAQSIGITKFQVEEGNTKYSGDETGMLYNKTGTQLVLCPPGFSGYYEFPAKVTSVASGAFRYCVNPVQFSVSEANQTFAIDESGVLFNKSKTSLILCPNNFAGSYVIPDTVTTLGSYAFYKCTKLTGVTIPDSVTTIGDSCFYKCTSLADVTLPAALKSIGSYAFAYCPNQTSADLPEGVTSVGSYAFAYCPSLVSATIPEGVTALSSNLFRQCENLSSIGLHNGIKTIGDYCFYKCTSLPDIMLPSALKKVGSYAFAYCPNQTSAVLPDSVTSVGSYAFAYCDALTNASIPEGITTLSATFRECKNLSSISLPSTITTFGDYCFYKCTSLPDIALPSTLKKVGSYAFAYCPSQTSAVLPDSVTSVGSYAFAYCDALTDASIPEGITTLTGTFRECKSLSAISIPDSVTEIGDYCFYKCYKLPNVPLPSALEILGTYAFSYCPNQTDCNLPESITEVGTAAFSYCTGLKKATIPASVTRIENSTFNECENLEEVTLHNGITYIGSYAFYDCKKLKQFELPGQLEEIGKYAFWFCSQFEEFVIPEGVTTLGESAFRYCANLKKIVVPGGVKKLGGYTFYGATNLTDVTLGEGLTAISDYMFYSCSRLESINIPEGVETIGVCAFKFCESLPEVKFPDSVTNIKMYAFEDCTALKTIDLPADLQTVGDAVFRNTGLTRIKIPVGMTNVGLLFCANCPDLKVVEFPASVIAISDAAFMNAGVVDVVFYGTEDQWNEIFVGVENTAVENALMHYDPEAAYTHTITDKEVSASCEVIGGTYHICTCGAQEIFDPVPPVGHNYSNAVIKEPSCSEKGIRSYVCANDAQHNYTEEIDFLAHTEVPIPAVEPNCTEKGATAGVMCSVCEKVLVAQTEISAVGHTDANGDYFCDVCTENLCANHREEMMPGKSATCTEDGLTEGKHCPDCGVVMVAQQTIPSKGHDWQNATCTSPKKCSACKTTSGKAVGHIYDDNVDGICNVCDIHREDVESRIVVHMFRMYNPNTGEHFYTGSEVERDNLIGHGWHYEGIGFTFPANTGVPVHRLFHEPTGEHLYTMDEEEKDRLMAEGWNYEGVAFNCAYNTEAVQYRLHNPNATCGAYHFTFSQEERQNLLDAGWEDQGIGWYSCWK